MSRPWWPPLLAALTIFQPLAPASAAANAPPAVSVSARAQTQTAPLTLAAALDRALASHPDMAAAHSEVEAADAARLQSGARPNPVLEAELEDTRRASRTLTVLLSQPIELGDKRAARVEAAERARDVAQERWAAQRSTLRAAVTTAFFDARAAQERVRLAGEAQDIARRAGEAAARRVLAGKVSPVEETKARVAEASVRVELLQAQAELRGALQALAAAVGVERVERVDDGEVLLPDVPGDATLQARLAGAPALRLAALEVERLGALAQLERARRVPDMTVGIGAKRSEETGRNQAVVSVAVPLPVFDTHRGAELEALRRQDAARRTGEAVRLRLIAEAARAQERLRAAVAESQALEADVLPGARTAYDAAATGFELGKFAFLDVLDAQRTLLQARTQRLRAAAEAHRAAAELERLLGVDDALAPTRGAFGP